MQHVTPRFSHSVVRALTLATVLAPLLLAGCSSSFDQSNAYAMDDVSAKETTASLRWRAPAKMAMSSDPAVAGGQVERAYGDLAGLKFEFQIDHEGRHVSGRATMGKGTLDVSMKLPDGVAYTLAVADGRVRESLPVFPLPEVEPLKNLTIEYDTSVDGGVNKAALVSAKVSCIFGVLTQSWLSEPPSGQPSVFKRIIESGRFVGKDAETGDLVFETTRGDEESRLTQTLRVGADTGMVNEYTTVINDKQGELRRKRLYTSYGVRAR